MAGAWKREVLAAMGSEMAFSAARLLDSRASVDLARADSAACFMEEDISGGGFGEWSGLVVVEVEVVVPGGSWEVGCISIVPVRGYGMWCGVMDQ